MSQVLVRTAALQATIRAWPNRRTDEENRILVQTTRIMPGEQSPGVKDENLAHKRLARVWNQFWVQFIILCFMSLVIHLSDRGEDRSNQLKQQGRIWSTIRYRQQAAETNVTLFVNSSRALNTFWFQQVNEKYELYPSCCDTQNTSFK